MKKFFLVSLLTFFCLFPLFSQDKDQEINTAIQNQQRTREIKQQWKILVRFLNDKNNSPQDKEKKLINFINLYPNNNPFLKESKHRLQLLKKDYKEYMKHYNPYRTSVEWGALGFSFTNYGSGLKIDIVTLNKRYFYWDILKAKATDLYDFKGTGYTKALGALFSSQIGIPIWFNSRAQLRIGTGPSIGELFYSNSRLSYINDLQSKIIKGQEINSYFIWSIEASFLIHFFRFATFQAGFLLDLPIIFKAYNYDKFDYSFSYFYTQALPYDKDKYRINYYRPLVGTFIAIRF